MKSILFLGGGKLGTPAIKWARNIGFNIIVNDHNINAPGIKYANTIINFDSTDIRNISNWVLINNSKLNIQYCHCGSDFGLLTSTIIHHILNLPTNPIRSIFNGLDKNLMKQSWEQSDIISPKSFTVKNILELYKAVESLGFPIVIKPSDSSGSRGVSIVKEVDALENAFNEALEYTDKEKIIVEKYIIGTHHDVNGLFWNGKYFPCGIGDRFFTPPPFPVPHHGHFPSSLPISKKKELYNYLKLGSISMGIINGPVKADFVIDRDGRCFVYEISPRFHGDIFTVRTLGFLKERNPVYQFYNMMFNSDDVTFYDVDDTNELGKWKTIFNNFDIKNKTKNGGIYMINKKTSSIVKNNTQIMGLAWWYENNFEKP